MSTQQVKVTFQPSGRTVHVLSGTTVLEAAAQGGLTIRTPCGGGGTCGKCRVQFSSGVCDPSAADEKVFNQDELQSGWRLLHRLAGQIGPVHASLSVIRDLSHVLRADSFKGTAVVAGHHLIGFEPGDTSDRSYG
ncbi:MAG: 2Fe-2S iron-sulfur cluster-binding protein, partial [Planctomycetota bacterium]